MLTLIVDIPRIVHGVDIYAPAGFTTVDWVLMYSTSAWFIVEVATMLTNDKRRALHDFIAGSVVVRKQNAAPADNSRRAGELLVS